MTTTARTASEPAVQRKQSSSGSRYLAALRSPHGVIGLSLLLFIVLVGVLGPLFISFSPYEQGSDALAGPSRVHLLGTDEIGRDILSRLVAGIRVDLMICLIAVPLSAALGTILGLAGGLSKIAGESFQRLFDLLLGFPGIILGIAVSLAMGAGFAAVVLTIVLVTIPRFGRQTRSALLTQLSRDYVTAAQIVGVPRLQVLTRHVLPNVLDSVVVLIAIISESAVKIEGGLSVVGLGIQPPHPSLGSMISSGSTYIFQAPQYALTPVIVLAALVFALTLISDALNRTGLRA